MEEVRDIDRVDFKLRDYQKDASDIVSEIFKREELNRYAALVLPTGGGKSFVGIDQLIKFNNPQYYEKARNGTINNANMVYIAPTNEILSQLKLHIVKHVLLSYPNIEKMTIDELDSTIKKDFPDIKFRGINNNDQSIITSDDATRSQKISAIVRQIDNKQIDKLVKKAFPNLVFKCYAGITENEDKEILNADFIVLDEVHRLGADKWNPYFFSNLQKNIKAKVLGITATPVRTDSKGQDMIKEIARLIYNKKTILPEDYLAKEMYVSDAIKDGIVISPQFIETDATLAYSEEYNSILNYWNNIKKKDPDSDLARQLTSTLEKMEEIIGFSPRKLPKDQIESKIEEQVANSIAKKISNPNGKYIAFLPPNKSGKSDKEKVEDAEFFLRYMKKIENQFKGVLDENGNPVKIKFLITTSSDKIYIDKEGNPTSSKKGKKVNNSESIKEFEDAPNDSGGITILLAKDILNEGVHVEGIDGAIMYRKTISPTTYLQQVGRCISSTNPNLPSDKQTQTQLFDAVGNTFFQITQNNGKDYSTKYDLDKLREISEWINSNQGIYPDINKEIPDEYSDKEKVKIEKEIRYAYTLKRLKFRYFIYKNSESIPLENKKNIEEIIKICNSINLWETDIPNRSDEQSVDRLSGNGFMQLTDAQKQFMELYNEIEQKTKKLTITTRVAKLMNVLRVLKCYKNDIKPPQGLMFKDSSGEEKSIRYSNQENESNDLMLDELLKENNFSQEQIEKIYIDLQDVNLLDARTKDEVLKSGEEYNIGKEMAFVRGIMWTSQKEFIAKECNYFENYTMEELINLGLIDEPEKDIESIINYAKEKHKTYTNVESCIDKNMCLTTNFIECFRELGFGLVHNLMSCSLKTGKKYFPKYDKTGYDISGYDKNGYDRFEFNDNNINYSTGTKYDPRGFYYDFTECKYINRYSGNEYDLLGYNIYGHNEEGFERPKVELDRLGHSGLEVKYFKVPLWHKRLSDNSYDSYGYEKVPKRYSKNNKAHYYNNSIEKNKAKDGFFFNCAKRIKGTDNKPLTSSDYYINDLDIDGFNKLGFKEIRIKSDNNNSKTVYINRDTSSIYNLEGRVYDPKSKALKLDDNIASAKYILRSLLEGKNMNKDNLIKTISKSHQWTEEETKKHVSSILDKAFEIYQNNSPKAFDSILIENNKYKSLNDIYCDGINSTEKRERIIEFFEICPRARHILEFQIEKNNKIWQNILEEIKANDLEIENIKKSQINQGKKTMSINKLREKNKKLKEKQKNLKNEEIEKLLKSIDDDL